MSVYETIPPLIIIKDGRFNVCGGDARLWLTKKAIRNADAFVIYDRDRTLWNCHAGTMSNNGCVLKILDLANPRMSSHYNPFAYIKDDKGALKLANAIMAGTKGLGKDGDIAFISAEAMLFSALISLIHNEAPGYERNINTLVTLLNYMEPDKFEDGFKYKDAVDILFDEKEALKPDSFFARQYRNFEEMAGEDAKEVIKSCAARLAPFDTEEMNGFLSDDKLRLNNLSFPKTAFFVNTGENAAAFNFLAALMYAQLFEALYESSAM